MAITPETVIAGAKLWMMIRPINRIKRKIRQARNIRRARKGLPLLDTSFKDEEDIKMELNTGLRTTSNMTIAGGIAFAICQGVDHFFPGLLGPEAPYWISIGIGYIVGRISRTPDKIGII